MLLHIPHIVELEPPSALLVGIGFLVLGLEGFVVRLWTGTELVLRVGKKVVGAVADEVRTADLGIGDAELRRTLVGTRHELLAHELLWVGVSNVVNGICGRCCTK